MIGRLQGEDDDRFDQTVREIERLLSMLRKQPRTARKAPMRHIVNIVLRQDFGVCEDLRPREFDVFVLVAQVLRNDEIANELGIGSKAVQGYISTLISKLGLDARDRLGLIKLAREACERASNKL